MATSAPAIFRSLLAEQVHSSAIWKPEFPTGDAPREPAQSQVPEPPASEAGLYESLQIPFLRKEGRIRRERTLGEEDPVVQSQPRIVEGRVCVDSCLLEAFLKATEEARRSPLSAFACHSP